MASADVTIHDIRRSSLEHSLLNDVKALLNPSAGGEKRLPTLLLYDERGLKLFEDITYLEDYYLTNAEIDVLAQHANDFVEKIAAGTLLLELGSGNLRKIKFLLNAFEKAEKPVRYFALDLSLSELQRTLNAVENVYRYVQCFGLLGTYDDGLAWLETMQDQKCILWLGSSVGNLTRMEAAEFLRGFSKRLRGRDSMIIGIDACQDANRIFRAYNNGKTQEFTLNGLSHANKLMGDTTFNLQDFSAIGEYDPQAGRHQAFLCPSMDLVVGKTKLSAGEKIRIEESYKYTLSQSQELWKASDLVPSTIYGNAQNDYHLHMVHKKPNTVSFATRFADYTAQHVPSMNEFSQLWNAWDMATHDMIPQEELLTKPIKLRNPCIFYLGHIPCFADIHMTRATGSEPTSPASYQKIFERGIDPDVDNPEHCHAHSQIPDEWPPLEDILQYQGSVRNRIKTLCDSRRLLGDHRLRRALWLIFEHEAMHLETFLYMLVQSDKTLPPSRLAPNFEGLAIDSRATISEDAWIDIPATRLNIGMDDPENNEGPFRYFGWDNEKPRRETEVHAFQTKAHALTNEDYARFSEQTGNIDLPASWLVLSSSDIVKRNATLPANESLFTNQVLGGLREFIKDKFVKTIFGPISLLLALDWPVAASFDQLSKCARFMNGRIPTAEEVQSIYRFVDARKFHNVDSILTRKISAVNGHLSNDGIEISPPQEVSFTGANGVGGQQTVQELFADLEGCNIGFRNFHPLPADRKADELCGRCELGGIWEWTSSVFDAHENFEPSELYPAYSADFFDGKHNIVLGGSWCTHPRIAGRKTYTNFYQRNYPYAFAGARLVRDKSPV